MRLACLIFALAFAFIFVSPVRADDPKDKPKETKPEQKDGGVRMLIVGKWSPVKDKEKTTIEFTKDGKIKITGEQNIAIDGEYKFVDDSMVQCKLSFGGEERSFRLKVTLTSDDLTTQKIGEGGKEEEKESFKRVK